MNLSELEKRKSVLLEEIGRNSSSSHAVFIFSEFMELLKSFKNRTLIQVYLAELYPFYIRKLKNFSLTGLDPKRIDKILRDTLWISQMMSSPSAAEFLNKEIHRLNIEKNEIIEKLEGKPRRDATNSAVFFPVLDINGEPYYPGYLIGFDVTIKEIYNTDIDVLKIIPSKASQDEELYLQAATSWNFAKSYFKKYQNISKRYFEIIIMFDKVLSINPGTLSSGSGRSLMKGVLSVQQ